MRLRWAVSWMIRRTERPPERREVCIGLHDFQGQAVRIEEFLQVTPADSRLYANRIATLCRLSRVSALRSSPVQLHLPDSFGFDGPRDPHRNYRDIGDPGLFHPAEFPVSTGRHCARDAGRRLDELRCFHDELPTVISTLKC